MNTITIIIITIISILIISLCLYFVIRYFQLKKKKEKIRLAKEKKWLINNRPRLDICEFKDEHVYENEQNIDLSLLMVSIKNYNPNILAFKFDPSTIEPQNWICVEYTFKNIGNAEINSLYITTNLPRSTSIFDIQSKEYLYCFENECINYCVSLYKPIMPQKTIRVKICYISNKIVLSTLGNPPLSIWLIDNNRNYWMQDLSAPLNEISNSILTTSDELKNATDVETALKCFKNPMLW